MALYDRILLATDLSARSDRALDRAMMLAAREGSQLVVLHVLEPVAGNRFYPPTQPLPALATIVRQQLLHDLGDCANKAQIRIEQGDPAEVIERVARELEATLVIVGVARVERLGRFVLGTTVDRLVRAVEAPLLIVTERARRPYQRVAVAVDLSAVSTQTLALATSSFPDKVTAFHAFNRVYGTSDSGAALAQSRQVAETNFKDWLAGTQLPDEARARVVARIEHGDPAQLLRSAAHNGDYDLVVIGTRGRGRIFEFFIGSVAKQILAELPRDALFFRETK